MQKNTSITIATGQINPAFESMIKQKDVHLKELAHKNGKHFAKTNRPHPDNDKLAPYTDEIKTGYERLASELLHLLLPKSHFHEGKMDIDMAKEKDKKLHDEIKALEDKNHHDEYEIGNYKPGNIPLRIWITGVVTFVITIGEIIFNTKAFQVTGENMLFALILSISVSFAVFTFSHIASFLLKAAATRAKRILVVFGSLSLVTFLFTALAIFRSTYLASHDVHISPVYFVVINLFFFIVSALFSFFILPAWAEIKENAHYIKLHNAILKRTKQIAKLKDEKENGKTIINEDSKLRIRSVMYSNYASDRVRKLYYECVAVFKSANLIFRTDMKTPQCFNETPPPPDINDTNGNSNDNLKPQ